MLESYVNLDVKLDKELVYSLKLCGYSCSDYSQLVA